MTEHKKDIQKTFAMNLCPVIHAINSKLKIHHSKLSLHPFACFPLTIPSKEVFLQSVQQGIETLLKIYEVSSTADKGGSRGVIEDKTPFFGKEGGVF